MLLLVPERMTLKQLISSVLEVLLSHFPIPNIVHAVIVGLRDILKGLIFRKKNVGPSSSVGGSDEIHKSGMPVGINFPVVQSQQPSVSEVFSSGDRKLNSRLQERTYVATGLVQKGAEVRSSSWKAQLMHVAYSYMLRNEINRPGIVDLVLSGFVGQTRSRIMLESIKTHRIPMCPVSSSGIQSCVHAMEGVTLLMGLDIQNNKYSNISSHTASAMTSLLGLRVALRKHREASRKYCSKYTSTLYSSSTISGGKEYISQSDGGVIVAQSPWVTGDVQTLSMGLDDALSRMLLKYGDVIPSFTYPDSYLDELKSVLREY